MGSSHPDSVHATQSLCERAPELNTERSNSTSINAVRSEYDRVKDDPLKLDGGNLRSKRELQSQKAPDKSLGANTMCDSVASCSVTSPSQLVLLNSARGDSERREDIEGNSEGHPKVTREDDYDVLTQEMIESLTQKLNDLADTGWRMKSKYDEHIKALHAKLKEQDLLISQLKNCAAMTMKDVGDSSVGIHQSYDDFLFRMDDSIKAVQAFKDGTYGIRDEVEEREKSEKKKGRVEKKMGGETSIGPEVQLALAGAVKQDEREKRLGKRRWKDEKKGSSRK